jgi:hypothetical protein
MTLELECWNCGKSLADVSLPISRHVNCSQCFEVLHCCRMCRYFDKSRPQQCDHDRTEPPVIKESSNFCDYFEPAPNRYAREDNRQQESAKSDFDALFGGESPDTQNSTGNEPSSTSGPESKFNDLFDD